MKNFRGLLTLWSCACCHTKVNHSRDIIIHTDLFHAAGMNCCVGVEQGILLTVCVALSLASYECEQPDSSYEKHHYKQLKWVSQSLLLQRHRTVLVSLSSLFSREDHSGSCGSWKSGIRSLLGILLLSSITYWGKNYSIQVFTDVQYTFINCDPWHQ